MKSCAFTTIVSSWFGKVAGAKNAATSAQHHSLCATNGRALVQVSSADRFEFISFRIFGFLRSIACKERKTTDNRFTIEDFHNVENRYFLKESDILRFWHDKHILFSSKHLSFLNSISGLLNLLWKGYYMAVGYVGYVICKWTGASLACQRR